MSVAFLLYQIASNWNDGYIIITSCKNENLLDAYKNSAENIKHLHYVLDK